MYYKNAESVMSKCEKKFSCKEFKKQEILEYIKEITGAEISIEEVSGYGSTEYFNYNALNNGREEFMFCVCVENFNKNSKKVSSFIPF